MLKDKKLFSLMIKYHPTFIGWLSYKGLIAKTKDGFIVKSNKQCKNDDTIVKPTLEPLLINKDGTKRISYWGYDKNDIFVQIYLIKGNDFSDIIDSGIDVYDIGNRSERYCHISQLEDLICNFSDIILDVAIPKSFHRLKGCARVKYIDILKQQLRFIEKNDYKFVGYYSFNYDIIGEFIGWSDNSPEKVENIRMHGIFANSSIYKRIEWDFEMVETYKDQIIWSNLINDSNLVWDESSLNKYDSYIPYCSQNQETYCDKFKDVIDYSKFDFLSNKFLDEHKDILEWREVFEKCKFKWDSRDIVYFCNYALGIDMPYSTAFMNTSASSQIEYSFHYLLDNPYFEWNASNLLQFLLISKHNWNALIQKHRPRLFKLFLTIPNIEQIAEPYVHEIDNFWNIVHHLHDFPYDELSSEFTVDNILKNLSNWSLRIEDKFTGMHRTPDTNYHFYSVITQWDIYKDRVNIPLTYELVKCLYDNEIKFGGSFVESDGGYIEEDDRFPVINGLLAFSKHHFASKEDLIKCICNPDLSDVLLNPHNPTNFDAVEFLINDFFQDYPLEDYLQIINKMQDWENLKIY